MALGYLESFPGKGLKIFGVVAQNMALGYLDLFLGKGIGILEPLPKNGTLYDPFGNESLF